MRTAKTSNIQSTQLEIARLSKVKSKASPTRSPLAQKIYTNDNFTDKLANNKNNEKRSQTAKLSGTVINIIKYAGYIKLFKNNKFYIYPKSNIINMIHGDPKGLPDESFSNYNKTYKLNTLKYNIQIPCMVFMAMPGFLLILKNLGGIYETRF